MAGSYRWTHGAGNSFQRLTMHAACGALLVLLALAMSAPARAQEHIPRGQPVPESIRWVNGNPGGASMSGSASWSNAYNTSHHRFPVQYSSNTLGALGRSALRRGLPIAAWAFAFKNLVEGAGWVIDELQGQVTSPGTPQEPLLGEGWCYATKCAPTIPQLLAHWKVNEGLHPNAVQWRGFAQSETYGVLRAENATGGGLLVQPIALLSRQDWTGYENVSEYAPPVPIDDAALGDLIKNHPQIVNGVSTDPDTGAPRRTAELTNALNALARALEAANGLDPGSLGVLAPADDLAEPVPSQTEWPGFCDWATVVCEFLEWVREDVPDPEKPEVPVEELLPQDIQQSWSSGLGGGSCPAPYSVAILDGSFEVSWDGICGFVDMLRPLLITIALVVGACIVAGVRVGKNA